MNRGALPGVAFATCGIIWGSTFLAIRVGNETLAPLWACTLRLAVACAILALIMLVTRQPWPRGEALKAACWYGFFEFGVGLPLLYWGEAVVPSGLAAVLYAICPVTAMFGARMLGMEKLNPIKLGAGVLAFAGVAVIFRRELHDSSSIAGLASILIAAVAAAFSALMLQRGPRQGAIGANAVGAFIGLVPSAIATVFLREPHRVPVTFAQGFPVLYLAVMSSAVAFGLFAWLMNHWKATTVSFLGVIVPMIAVIAGVVFQGEKFAPEAGIGAGIIIVGVIVALRADAVKRPRPQAQAV